MSRITDLITRYHDGKMELEALAETLATMPMAKPKRTRPANSMLQSEGIELMQEGTWEEVTDAVGTLLTPDEYQTINAARWEAQHGSKEDSGDTLAPFWIGDDVWKHYI